MLAQPSSRALAAHRRPSPSGPASAAAPSAPRPCRCRACRPGSGLGRAGALRVTAFREDTAAAQPPLKTEEQRRMAQGQGQGQEGFAEGQRQRLSRRGWAVRERKAPLAVWSHTLGELGPQEVDIRVTHNGLCHTDLHMRDDDWGVSKFPFIPGHEVVGEVVGVGSAVPASLRPGSRVGVGWIANSCRSCLACLRGEENVCEKGYTGLIVGGNHGGFQEVLRVTSDFLYSIPDALGSEDAAPLLCAGITVYAPLKRHMARPGMAVAVLGVGGLGHLALQVGGGEGGGGGV
ncbi:hypothetical protein HYH03_018872 [Edaphochlamys debaryana]|uniref:alcohol dehydrogenase (NADP(+)) n=1 Tax=Edaphochlamys debaryana TaxID=47281 RepID=A0A836BMW1_9CHLO|nr:hypothetical protein HYH03_018872 [Edaphochlamys debaryana]|eukprot:KAG2482172.1 hypothetical protein HYH03_018872 [Edaphochlamys debaryana]